MDEKPKRRWFAFRLRTLFVVVAILSVPLAWVGYQASVVNDRKVMRARIKAAHPMGRGLFLVDLNGKQNWVRRMIGERQFSRIAIAPKMVDQRNLVQDLFPEAEVKVADDISGTGWSKYEPRSGYVELKDDPPRNCFSQFRQRDD